jgi:hypothetical protein
MGNKDGYLDAPSLLLVLKSSRLVAIVIQSISIAIVLSQLTAFRNAVINPPSQFSRPIAPFHADHIGLFLEQNKYFRGLCIHYAILPSMNHWYLLRHAARASANSHHMKAA